MASIDTFTEVGGHRVNEDAFVVQAHPVAAELWLCFVADGQGGQAGGGPAARLACQAALDAAKVCSPERLREPSAWASVLRVADEAVRADSAAGLTTLVGFGVGQGWLAGASNGDSAALLLCGDQVVDLTSGQHKKPPIGSGVAAITPFAAALVGPWRVLAMTDGVWKYVGWNAIVPIARRMSGEPLIAELQRPARGKISGQFPDDFTVVVLEA